MNKPKIDVSLINDEIANYILDIRRSVPWDFSNKILYDLCEKYPSHSDPEIIIAKTIIIGRVYAATLERNAIKSEKSQESRVDNTSIKTTLGDDFYLEHVVPLFKSFFGRREIRSLEDNLRTQPSRKQALELQSLFSTELKKLNRGGKTSFSSKYLHFHFPNSFYMNDTRAREALPYLKLFLESKDGETTINWDRHCIELETKEPDIDYVKFENYCHALKCELEKIGVFATNRQFDNLLIHIANGRRRSKTKKTV